jgi:hypothetical protein
MSNSNIVPKLITEELCLLFRKEAKIANNGSVEFSRRGVERLISVSRRSLLRLLNQVEGGAEILAECLQPYVRMDFKGGAISEDLAYSSDSIKQSRSIRSTLFHSAFIKLNSKPPPLVKAIP